ncbi:hypothetical protein MRX96_003087 [Rhipicephalus microplus]
MAVPAQPATFTVTFGYLYAACNKRRRDVAVAFDMPNKQFGRHFRSSVGGEDTVTVTQPMVSICVRRVAGAIINTGTHNKWVHFPRTAEEIAVVKE